MTRRVMNVGDHRSSDAKGASRRNGGRHYLPATFCLVLLLLAGCGGRSDDSATGTAAGMTNDASGNVSRGVPVAPAEVQAQKLEVPEGADSAAVVDELNRELRKWVMRNRRRPANFEEFISTAQIQLPPAPPGKKYTLSKEMRIELVDR